MSQVGQPPPNAYDSPPPPPVGAGAGVGVVGRFPLPCGVGGGGYCTPPGVPGCVAWQPPVPFPVTCHSPSQASASLTQNNLRPHDGLCRWPASPTTSQPTQPTQTPNQPTQPARTGNIPLGRGAAKPETWHIYIYIYIYKQ